VGNQGYSGSPAADTYQCTDGWLSVAANTPAQFRKLAAALGVEDLCTDPKALDLDAFNRQNGGFVVARDREYVHTRIGAAFATRSAVAMEEQLSELGVPGARVRRIGEFLDEARAGAVPLAEGRFTQDQRTVYTPGLGFHIDGDDGKGPGAEHLGQSGRALLAEIGIGASDIERLAAAGVVRIG
jgi:crotonobetainyl-CoA:carnitine CoA-transferase CaiB-like acyl-CoA transferase